MTAIAVCLIWGESYSYDGFGNLTAKTVTADYALPWSTSYNANNQQSGGGYDANGNFVGCTSCLYGYWYSYDVENRMVTVNNDDLDTAKGYAYDPQGKRVMVEQTSGTYPSLMFFWTFNFYSVTGQLLNTFGAAGATYFNSGVCSNGANICTTAGPTPGYLYISPAS